MKRCPYCAEEIQDAAIKCRFCQSWLVDEIPAGAETPPAARVVEEPKAEEPTTSVVEVPEEAIEPVAQPETGEAGEDAAVQTPEPEAAEETTPSEATTAVVAAATAEAAATPTPEAAPDVAAAPAEPQPEWTHSGERYLLGYTDSYFGIWDRQSPAAPMERFARTDDGWRQAWQRYASLEGHWMDLRTGQRSP